MSEERGFTVGPQGAEAEQSGMIPGRAREGRFGFRLRRPTAHSRDSHDSWTGLRSGNLFDRQLEHRLEQTNLGITNGKLSRMNSHGQTSSSSREIVTEESPLSALIQLPP